MAQLLDYLKKAVEYGASDLFLVAGTPVSAKINGEMQKMDGVRLLPPVTESFIEEIFGLANRSMQKYRDSGDDDFSFAVRDLARFRVNAFRQRGSAAAVIRIVCFDIPDYSQLNIPDNVMDVASLLSGMVLVTGTAGSGKSTTLACVVDRINRTRNCHIITLEDPIEYLHQNRRSIVSQREIAIDTLDSLSGLRACLRQAPDVIQLGEMRDQDTIRTAMTAAETGHLLLATLHTKGAVSSIDRIIDSFPSGQQDQIRIQLSDVLNTVVSQRLLPDVDGGRIPAFEIMHTTGAIRSMIRERKTHQIDNAIAAGAAEKMMSMDQSIYALFKSGRISGNTAVVYADNPEQMSRKVGL